MVMVDERHVVALNAHLRASREAHRATRRLLTAALLELMDALARIERRWSPDRARLFLSVLAAGHSLRRAARVTGVTIAETRRWRTERRILNWRGRRALFEIHLHTVHK